MLQLFLESIEQVFALTIGFAVYWFLWVKPAIEVGTSLTDRLSRPPVDPLSVLLHFLLFIIFAFPTVSSLPYSMCAT